MSEPRLTDVDYWLTRQAPALNLPAAGAPPAWYRYAEPFLPTRSGCSCLEIGVHPGAMLLYLARRHGWDCTGLDFSPRVREVEAEFHRLGVPASFVQTDFFAWSPERQYDIVYSCGFIEHFTDYREAIRRHWNLVKPGGLLILSVPALTPYQRLVRRVFYTRSMMKEVLESHNLKVMNLPELEASIRACPGSSILVARYTREATVWFGPRSRGIRPWTRPFFLPIRLLNRLGSLAGLSSRFFSPEVLVIARKNV